MPESNYDIMAANGISLNPVVVSADGAIPLKAGTYHITKGSACILTIAAPTAANEGDQIRVFSETAFAHTLTNTAPGFNNLGASGDVGTYGAAVGNQILLEARNLIWWVLQNVGVTLA